MTFVADLDAALAYDRWFDNPWGRYAFRAEMRVLLAAVGDMADRRVLDVGCGTGRLLAELERRGARTVGLDIGAAMLEVAEGSVACPLVLGDASDLPFTDEYFDVAVATTVCEFVADVGLVFGELARVTRPGGRFVVGALNPRSPWGLGKRDQFFKAPWSEARFLSCADLLSLGRRHGHASLKSALFAAEGMPGMRYAGPLLEFAGRAMPTIGAFQVLTVERPC